MISWLFGTDKGSDVIDKVSNGIDAAIFTDQEKKEYYLKYLEVTQPQNIARRLISMVVSGVWAFIVLAAAICGLLGAMEKATYLLDLLFKVVMPTMTVIASFYFYKRIRDN